MRRSSVASPSISTGSPPSETLAAASRRAALPPRGRAGRREPCARGRAVVVEAAGKQDLVDELFALGQIAQDLGMQVGARIGEPEFDGHPQPRQRRAHLVACVGEQRLCAFRSCSMRAAAALNVRATTATSSSPSSSTRSESPPAPHRSTPERRASSRRVSLAATGKAVRPTPPATINMIERMRRPGLGPGARHRANTTRPSAGRCA